MRCLPILERSLMLDEAYLYLCSFLNKFNIFYDLLVNV